MATSPTGRTLAECRKREWPACVVEKWVPQARRRVDAFGFGDLLVLDGEPGSLLVQATAGHSNVSSRCRKIINERCVIARAWLLAGNRIEVWGWIHPSKTKPWRLKRRPIVLADVPQALCEQAEKQAERERAERARHKSARR